MNVTGFRHRVDLDELYRRYYPYLLVAPLALWLLTVYLFPLGRVFWLSVTDSSLTRIGEFTGLDNFISLLDVEFYMVLYRTVIWTFGSLAGVVLIGLAGALILRQYFYGRDLALAFVLIPWATPLSIVGYMWYLFYAEYSLLNNSISFVTGSTISFLGPDMALASVIFARIWKGIPFALIIYQARLQSIPKELYEAAKIDGANKWATFRYVTLPELANVTIMIMILLTIWITVTFDIVFVMTRGGPGTATLILPVDIYNTLFFRSDMGGSAARSTVMVVFLLAISLVYWKMMDRARGV